jgi:hypothetical protein
MKVNTLMIITAILLAVYGIGFVIAPAPLLSLMGITADPAVAFITQAFGAALIGYAVMNWFARNAVDSDARQAIVLADASFNALAIVVNLLGTLSGVLNVLGWSNVVIHLLLAAGFAYFLVKTGLTTPTSATR